MQLKNKKIKQVVKIYSPGEKGAISSQITAEVKCEHCIPKAREITQQSVWNLQQSSKNVAHEQYGAEPAAPPNKKDEYIQLTDQLMRLLQKFYGFIESRRRCR